MIVAFVVTLVLSNALVTSGGEAGDQETSAMILNPPDLECGIWLAPSTIPGAGLGMYAGRDFNVSESMHQNHNQEPVGDLCIPFVDLPQHYGEKAGLLWSEYVWGYVQENELAATSLSISYFHFTVRPRKILSERAGLPLM
jgi:hypothetical protein